MQNINYLDKTQKELIILKEQEFNNSVIEMIIQLDYPGMGNYKLFKITGQNTYHPIILAKFQNHEDYELFMVGSILNKSEDSLNLKLRNTEEYQIQIRDPKEEFDTEFVFPFYLTSFLLFIQILLKKPIFYYIFKEKEHNLKRE
jgi:hypothetical protein